jgi:hypothetical protein
MEENKEDYMYMLEVDWNHPLHVTYIFSFCSLHICAHMFFSVLSHMVLSLLSVRYSAEHKKDKNK